MTPPFLKPLFFTLAVLALGFSGSCPASTDSENFEQSFENEFDDKPLSREIEHPAWFKESFLDLREDLAEARAAGKKGIALYFGQKHCAYCKALMEINFTKPDIVDYVRDNFDVIPLDIWGSRTVTLFDGTELAESELATFEETNFTPSLIFFDEKGEQAFKMRGYYNPYRFQAVMKFIVEGFYRNETFRAYLERADPPPRFSEEELNEHEQIVHGPMILDRRAAPGSKPLAVLFEQKQCHACDQLHSAPLNNEITKEWLKGFELRQVDAWSDTPVVTPDGQHLTASEWAKRLGVHFMPTTVFFDENGKEILRVDSVVKLYRMRSLLSFILTNGYKNFGTFQQWRRYTSVER